MLAAVLVGEAGGGVAMKGATIFSGGELVGVGMIQAGLEHRWGIEIDNDIASVARANGFNVITGDVLEVNPATMEPVDYLHASPVCTNASVANQGAGEDSLDMAAGHKTAEFIDVMRPHIFTLENVYQYRNFEAFGVIRAALERNGYMYDFANVNAADFGVPQSRRRLILRAVLGALLPPLPPPVPWVGWYEAIEDLVPSLPETQFAPWQLKRLPAMDAAEPVFTVTAGGNIRAFVVSGGQSDYNDGDAAFVTSRNDNEPAFTVTAGEVKRPTRAWLAQGRVVKMSPRALARFQSIPDSYLLPEKASLACKIIGNAVPPLLMRKITKGVAD